MTKLKTIEYLKTVINPAELGECKAEIAFVGRSNVGKSSLLNAGCGRKNMARTSQVPGKTRAINVFVIGHGPWIVDLPGYGFAVGPPAERDAWQAMIEGYLLGRPSLRMVFMLVDAKVGATKLDKQMSVWLQSNGIPFRVVANKCDKISLSKHQESRREIASALELAPEYVYWVSALKGTGIAELECAAAEALELIPPQGKKPR
jgi:GTP-binding protein